MGMTLGKGVCSLDELIDALNIALNAGAWAEVCGLAPLLYQVALAEDDTQLAELVQDLCCIAQDALAHPLEVRGVLV